MTKEDKELLLKDLCARLLYGVKCLVNFDDGTKEIMTLKTGLPNSFGRWDFYNENYSGCSNNFKPYLRPMSSMTEEEKEEENKLWNIITKTRNDLHYLYTDFLLSHHLDYRGLIPMGLALEASEGMYSIK